MNRAEFMDEVESTLDVAEPLKGDQVLIEIPDYDSLAVLNLLSLYDGLGVAVTPQQINEAVTVDDLVALAGSALTDG